MIQLTKDEIRFSLPEQALLLDGDARKAPLARRLLSGHVCPHCGVIVRALFETDDRIKNLTKKHFNLDDSLTPSKFANTTLNCQIAPKYRSYFIKAGGMSAELLMEDYHFNYNTTKHSTRCFYSVASYNTSRFDLVFYMQSMINLLWSRDWHQPSYEYFKELFALFGDGTSERAHIAAEKIYNEVKTGSIYDSDVGYAKNKARIKIAEDVTGSGTPMWLIAKKDWSMMTIQNAIKTQQLIGTF
jgi:hypothetical protein